MKRFKLRRLAAVAAPVVMGLICETAHAQNSSLFQYEPRGEELPLTLPQASWTYIAPLPPPKKVQLHDPVVVRVDELARMSSDGELNRRKTSTYNAQLKDWLLWPSLLTIKPDPQADGDQRIQGQLQQQNRATSEMEARESLTLNISCEIIDIRPNGLLVLEGHNQQVINEENWEVSLTGMCRPEDIGPDNTVFSKHLLHQRLERRTRGQVRDGYKRGWFVRWFDQFDPF
jgi:flagellar L-ring protein precursor FlgH